MLSGHRLVRSTHSTRGSALLFAAAMLVLPTQAAFAAGTVNVLYAGSLVNLMEHGIGPAFDKATGDQFQGYAGGSRRARQPDQGQAAPGRRVHQRQPQGERRA